MASNLQDLKQALTPALLEEVRHFWFDHLGGEDHLILPGQSAMMRWFRRDADFDKACVAQFQPALEAILDSGASAKQILDVVDTSSPLTWLSIILLLDQLPRNCYRGDESRLAFERFDPLAEEVALRAIDAGIQTQSSDVRYRLSYRFWFHLPLMHSENLAVHEKAMAAHEDTAKDMEGLLRRDAATLDADENRCFTVLSNQQDALEAFLSSTLEFEKRHKVIIEQFGRYPHRNQVLGRVSTAEEVGYLENGGETFSE
ncbi:hypothetical protein N7462_010281 [Penicillium macrosclerotiorum]|uniref:uncharacterized protein n=1 Tax=Penicillium macrosclerotiorum TaxID=303699 RepID=UPI0025479E7A|nr:uncharacterized protein N7462_010281 [Penicillium macrosclerotiorum]KAJ5669211.1 hypothetical protein N7462_010281 [Penicillium macrosclerotiorum]